MPDVQHTRTSAALAGDGASPAITASQLRCVAVDPNGNASQADAGSFVFASLSGDGNEARAVLEGSPDNAGTFREFARLFVGPQQTDYWSGHVGFAQVRMIVTNGSTGQTTEQNLSVRRHKG